jgi:3-deoxy-D-manno-octulosonic-acid transferase
MIRIYTLAIRLGLFVLSPYFLIRSRKYWPTLSDRFGYLKLPNFHDSVWLHAVSVGEFRAAEGLLEKIRKNFPDRPILVSTTTPAGQELARARQDIINGTFYFPFDLPGPVKRTLNRIQPALVIVAETEIWPNFLRECRGRQIPVMMINGRISDKSFPRYKRVRRWLGPVLDGYAVLGMQSEIDRKRIQSLGANPQRVRIFGNMKFDSKVSSRVLDNKLSTFLGSWKPLWIAASTMPGEDEMVLDAFTSLRKSRPQLKLLIAPRHLDRTDNIAEVAHRLGLKCTRRTQLEEGADVMILNTIGELAGAFEFASVVFVGGSLVQRGGHNVLEPARYARPIIFGPHMENFRDVARMLLEAEAAMQVAEPSALGLTVNRILSNPSLADSLGKNAQQVLHQNGGATDRVMDFIRGQALLGL